MVIVWDKVLPVIVSIGIIIAVAILREKSEAFSAIAATMPINIPLGMWIVYSGAKESTVMPNFTHNVFLNMFPTLIFAFIVMIAARWGWGLVPSIAIGYLGWGTSFAILQVLRPYIPF
jgi:hypothetical protein